MCHYLQCIFGLLGLSTKQRKCNAREECTAIWFCDTLPIVTRFGKTDLVGIIVDSSYEPKYTQLTYHGFSGYHSLKKYYPLSSSWR